MNNFNNLQLKTFTTSFGSQISPYIQRSVIKRIGFNDDREQIIREEIQDILDSKRDMYDEASEVYSYCEDIFNTNTQHEPANN